MSRFVYAYRGGSLPQTEAERESVTAAWAAWLGGIGAAALDPGNPFGASASVGPDGAVGGSGGAALGGYSIVSAADLDAATGMARGCPVLAAGGSVDVYEVVELM